MDITVETIVSLQPPIAATRDVAGRRYGILLKTGPARVVFPLDESDPRPATPHRNVWPTFPGKRPPRVLQRIRMSAESSVSLVPGPNQLNVDAFLCRAAITESLNKPGLFEGIQLAQAIGDWLEIARPWIGAWSGGPQNALVRRPLPEIQGVLRQEGAWTRVSVGGDVETLVQGHLLATSEHIRAAFAAASAQISLPLAHRMLARATTSYYLGDYRTCVIDACCAAEVALGTAVFATIQQRDMDDKTRETFLSKTSGVIELFRLFLVARGSAISAKTVMDQLARPRNKAAHEGDQPKHQEAKRALQTADLLLKEASPLPSPSDLLRSTRAVRVHSVT